MTVERNKDGSVTIRSNNGVTTIGKIEKFQVEVSQDKFEQWVEDCAKLVTPCAHTLNETIQYFLQQCDALIIGSDDRRMKNFKLNVIMNHCKDKLVHQAPEFSFDMTDVEIEKWQNEEDAMRQEVMNSSPEQFGLNMCGYYLLHTERNEIFYEQAYQEVQMLMKHSNKGHKQFEVQDICFYFEETTGHCESSGGGRRLMNQLIAFRGVGEDDIEKRSSRFLGYISALREMGNLSDFYTSQ
jgi:hypothetical protein